MRNCKELSIYSLRFSLIFILLSLIGSMMIGCAVLTSIRSGPASAGEVRFYTQEGDRYLQEGNYSKAVESYSAAIKLDPKSIDARRKLGEAHANNGRVDLALEEFAKIIQIDPNYIHAYNFRGFLYNNQQKWAEAAGEFESALKVDPNNLYALNHLGLMYKMMSRFEDAKSTLKKAAEIDPEMDDPESKNTHNYLGLVYQDEGDYEAAEDEFRKALEHFPEDAETHSYLGAALENMQRYEDAAGEYYETLKADPENEFAISRLQELQKTGIIQNEIPSVDIVVDDVEQYISNAPDASEYPGAGAIILLDKLSYDATDKGLARYTIHQIVKVLNRRGIEEFGEIAIPYNAISQNIGINVARTILPDGTEVEVPFNAFHDITPPGLSDYNLYSDVMYKVISMPALQPGAILEYKVTLEDAGAIAENFWILGGMAFQWVEPVLVSKCIVRVPKSLTFKWKLYNHQIEPVITEDEIGRLTYIWISRNNPEIVPEIAMPPFEEVTPFLMFSTVGTWDEVYKWYKDLADPQEQADQAIKRKTAELVVEKAGNSEKTKAIFEFVASEIRYVAIELGQSAYQPHSAIDVFKYRYGDCKDKVTLLITMLREAGVDAYPVLISPAPHRSVDIEVPSIGQFSHVIAAVELEDGGYAWLDPTIDTCSYGDLPAGDQGREAFVIGRDKGEFIATPVYPSVKNKISSTSAITLMEDGSIRGWERTTAKGQTDMYLRSVYRLIRPDRLKGYMEIALNSRYPGLQVESVQMSDLDDLDAPVDLKVDFSCPDYGSNLGNMMTLPLPSEGFSAYAALVGSIERQYDFHLGYNMAVEKVLTLSIPEGYKVASLPRDESLVHELGTFERRYEELDDSTIKYSVSFKIDVPIIPAASYKNLKKLMEIAAREDRAQLVLVKSRTPVSIQP